MVERVYRAVLERLEKEKEKITEYSENASNTPNERTPKIGVRDFWPELEIDPYRRTTNLPTGTNLFTRLPLGDKPVLDIAPVQDEQEVIDRFGFGYRSILPFAKKKLVVPILYDPDPEAWRGEITFRQSDENDLINLISHSYFHRGRMKSFCLMRDAEHAAIEDDTYDKLIPFTKKGLKFRFAPNLDLNNFSLSGARAVANRVAYLHTFNESNVFEKACELLNAAELDASRFQAFAQFVHAQKWLICSDITASIGGVFSISNRMKAQFESLDVDPAKLRGVREEMTREQLAAWEWVTRRAANGAFDVEAFQVRDAESLSVLVGDPDFQWRKERMNDEVENLLKLLSADVPNEHGVEVSAKSIEEQVRGWREDFARICDRTKGIVRTVDEVGKHLRYVGWGVHFATQGMPFFEFGRAGLIAVGRAIGGAKFVADRVVPNLSIAIETGFARRKLGENKLRLMAFDSWLSGEKRQ